MKPRIFTLLCWIFLTGSISIVHAQTPQKMSFQAVVKDNAGNAVASSPVGIRISILHQSPTGTAVYSETHTVSTNANGLASLVIGNGTVLSGSIASINWADGNYYIKTDTDPTGGTNYTASGTSPLLSVPYALHAQSVENISETDPKVGDQLLNNYVPKWDGSTLQNSAIYDDNGNIGIGTEIPSAKLDVEGNVNVSVLKVFSGMVLDADGENNGDGVNIMKFGSETSGEGIGSDRQNGTNNFGLDFYTNGFPRLSVSNSGNVGINTISPTEKLEVAGKTKTTDIQITNGATAGYVLQSDETGNGNWVNPATLSNPETDPQVSSETTNKIPKWDGTSLVDGVMQDNGAGVGINTAPVAGVGLAVNGKTSTSNLQITSGANNGYLLQSDASGNTTWVNPSTLPLTETDPQVSSTTANRIPKWNGFSLVDGIMQDNGVGVGINTTPVIGVDLAVNGKTTTSSLQITTGATNGYVLQSSSTGNATWVNPSTLTITETDPQVAATTTNKIPKWNGTSLTDGIILDNGVGLGINTTPVTGVDLAVNGKTATASLQVTTGATNGYILQSNESGNASWVNPATLPLTETDPQVTSATVNRIPKWTGITLQDGIIQDNGVGLGVNTAPVAGIDLSVNGKTATASLQVTTGATNGYILQSNANGNATWVNPSTLPLTETDPQVGSALLNKIPKWDGSSLIDGIILDNGSGVGINTAPVTGVDLAVNGKTVTSSLQVTTGATNGYVLQSSSTGNATWVNPSTLPLTETDPQVTSTTVNRIPRWGGIALVDGIIQDNGVGLGVNTAPAPGVDLSVNGKTVTSSLQVTTGAANGYILQSSATGNATWVNPATLPLTESDPQVTSTTVNKIPRWNGTSLTDGYIQDSGTSIGIGTLPVNGIDLAVNKTLTSTLQITTGAVNGYILQSNPSGNASWVNPATLPLTETDPQVASSLVNKIPKWNGTSLIDGIIQDDGLGIGINTTPVAGTDLAVNGKIAASSLQLSGGAVNGYILQSNATGTATWVNPTTLAIIETDPQVASATANKVPRWSGTTLVDGYIQDSSTGIGVGTAPVTGIDLTVNGKTKTADIQLTNGAASGFVLKSDASGNATWVDPTTLPITETDPQVALVTTNKVPRWNGTTLVDGYIQDSSTGIGVGTAPVTGIDLTVNGKTKTTDIQLTNGAAPGFVLKSDASGNATWVNPLTLNTAEIDPQVTSSITGMMPKWNGTTLVDGLLYDDGTNVGIGTTTPTQAKFVVNGSDTNTLANYGFLNRTTPTGTLNPGTAQSYSIYASNRIAASEFNAFSDARIKNIIGISNSKADLKTLMGIEITDYKLKDSIAKGNKDFKKVIAQQVEKVYPQAVSTITDVVPDIYKPATAQEGIIALRTDLKAGEKVKLIGVSGEMLATVLSVSSDNFTIDKKETGNVFVYGRQVDDFHTVDYEALATLNISATQELVKKIQLLENTILELKTENHALRAEAATYEGMKQDIENIKAFLYQTNLSKTQDTATTEKLPVSTK